MFIEKKLAEKKIGRFFLVEKIFFRLKKSTTFFFDPTFFSTKLYFLFFRFFVAHGDSHPKFGDLGGGGTQKLVKFRSGELDFEGSRGRITMTCLYFSER